MIKSGSIVTRYLGRELGFSMLAVSLVLLVIIMGGRLIKYLAQAAAGSIDPGVLASVMAYRLPAFLELILPLGFFLGILLGYGRLYVESEMTVLNACGISQSQVLRSTFIYASILAVCIAALSLWVSPWGLTKTAMLLQQQSSASAVERLAPGRFQKSSDGRRVTYVEANGDAKWQMKGIFMAVADQNGQRQQILVADEGRQQADDNNEGRYWILNEGSRYTLTPGQADVVRSHFAEYGAKIAESEAAREIDQAETLSTARLLRLEQPARDLAHLQWRLSLPVMIFVVTLLALPLAQVNPRQGRFAKLIPAILVYLAYLFLLSWARTQVVKGHISPYIGLWWVHLLFLAVGVALMWGPDWWRQQRYRQGLAAGKGVAS
ncbi:LPS export ABC transporter permease LptF [Pokkaliibacter sp. MBI-7]|uniref:LPS export ABC transporter permease LptF n=1 Tax=Pokkaliibacter sp. MBI-7 TaxID=3040600 RepID=UPI002449C341|nr:LPS export ABC transporter permease LptF [Pokkaliibacter sp. MBI-7]MDH2431979.1 LPS export ABC transporter permease LptF [Pokkaliibacter sp. MBI-7]